MLISESITTLKAMKLHGMAEALQGLSEKTKGKALSLSDGLGLLITHEQTYRDNKKRERLLKQAKLRHIQACPEHIDFAYPRQLDKNLVLELCQTTWLTQHRNLIIMGATGLGKTYIACAIGQAICRQAFRVRYFRISKLLEQLRMAHADGTYTKFLEQLVKTNLLILDDWGIDQLERQQRIDILEIIEDRYQRGSVIITTQLPIEHWHQYIGDNTIADAILDRLLAKAAKITLEGESMRKALDSN